MNKISGVTAKYRENYADRISQHNGELFDSPYVWQFAPDDLPLDPRKKLPGCKRTLLEIGFGHGEVLEELVSQHPEIGFVGIERRSMRVNKTLKRLHRLSVNNVFLLRLNLELLNRNLFSADSFDEILVNHPDPWPRERHEHRRFFSNEILDWMVFILKLGGSVDIASDHTEYFFTILRLFEGHPRFESGLLPPFYVDESPPGRPASRFERKKRAAGSKVRLMRFVKK
ncbi:hypothetical protein CEE37_06410 [candidate division LCP-89 bacterium B3_LCP]|uniref:tRNA (guanine-N(7)-)-methyltransferase n=1 Tax=candidate division LCP-89 bacterium B3_LCP TaxID=2012998 RepID=A0A532V245_UNCL8|nr:MAG: hypothetical protein CEE37_06410 [candidate division LCP-89 bacterium B3_LCP]